jgi:hypothetical protein
MALTRLVNDFKDSVKAATTTNITLSGGAPTTVDGISLVANDRVLVKNQTDSTQNGVYRVTTLGTGSNGTWTRAADFNDYREISAGATIFVEQGSISGNVFYFIPGGVANVQVGTTNITFSNLFTAINTGYQPSLSISNSTQSTSSSSGALIVTGGAGIGSNLWVGGNAVVAGNLTIQGTTTTVSNEYVTNTEWANVFIANGGTTSTSQTTGTVQVLGGLGVAGNIYAYSINNTPIGNASPNIGIFTSIATTTTGGNGNVSIGGNLTISAGGNLYISGTAIGRFYTGNTAPASPNTGDTWYQGNADVLFEYVQDAANNKFWLDISSNPSSYGNITVSNTITINGNLSASITSMNLTGGTAGYLIKTDGAGNLSWTAPASAAAGGGNTMVQFNDTATISGATYVQYNKTSGNLVSNSTTAATSTTTGALVLSGGAAVGGALYANNFSGIAVYAGTIGNVSANLVGANVVAQYANATSGIGLSTWSINNNYYGLFNYLGNPSNNEYILLSGTTDASTYVSSRYGGSTYIRGNNNSATYQLQVNNTGMTVYGGLVPSANNSVALGSASAYWSTIYGVSFVGTSTTAKYADLAEKYTSDAEYQPGTVVIFGGESEITTTDISHDERVAGVISTNPAYLMNDDCYGLPVALTGRVPCRVRGPVSKGQQLVTSTTPGVAQAMNKIFYTPGCIIGKSLENITDGSIQTIEIVAGRL